jgi:signal transduction histidine kinase
LRRDVAKRERATERAELGFLILGPCVVVAAAQVTDPAPPLALLGLLPAVLAFAARGLFPRFPAEVFAAGVIVPVLLVVGADGDLEMTLFLLVLMVLYVAWQLGSVTRAASIALVAAAVPIAVAIVQAPESGIFWAPWTAACGFTFALGRTLQRQRTLIDELERARETLAHQAVADERRRIARELHDLAGHTLAAMLLHVTGARHVLRRDTAEAERALLDAESVGRESLDHVRTTVAALRTVERGTDPPLSGGADLIALLDEYQRAGLRIDVSLSVDVAVLDATIGVALHRIVREALANVARHAPNNAVRVEIQGDAEELHVSVRDCGRPPGQGRTDGAGFGVIGMAERARAVGGRVRAGPTDDGWLVEATLPHRERRSAGSPS